MRKQDPEPVLYVALSTAAYQRVFRSADSLELMQEQVLRLILVDVPAEVIVQWIH